MILLWEKKFQQKKKQPVTLNVQANAVYYMRIIV